MNYFFDSGALVKLYHLELGSPRIEAAFHEADRRIIISRLTGAELHSALSLKIRTGRFAIAEAALLRTRFLAGAIVVVAMNESHYSTAENLIVRYGGRIALRTLDALQLAVALDTNRRAGLDAFMVADLALAEVARAEGLVVINPTRSEQVAAACDATSSTRPQSPPSVTFRLTDTPPSVQNPQTIAPQK